MRRTYGLVTIAAAVVLAYEAVPYRLVIVKGASMMPTYTTGSIVLATRDTRNLKRGDIVVANVGGSTIIKRVAFLPGDNYVMVKVADTWVNPASVKSLVSVRRKGWAERTMTVPDGNVFVVGDNAAESTDSRTFGPVAISDVELRLVNPKAATTGPCLISDGPNKPGYMPLNCN